MTRIARHGSTPCSCYPNVSRRWFLGDALEFGFLPYCSAETITGGGRLCRKTFFWPADKETTLDRRKRRSLWIRDGKQGSEVIRMGAENLPGEFGVRRIWEGTVATVVGGLVLWLVTSSTSQPARTTERTEVAVAPPIQFAPITNAPPFAESTATTTPGPEMGVNLAPLASIRGSSAPVAQSAATPSGFSLAASTPGETPAPPLGTMRSLLASTPGSKAGIRPPQWGPPPCGLPVGSILLYDDFSYCKEGEVTDWGPNTFIKRGLDRRNWLVSSVAGTHPVGRRLRLPDEFHFECRYSAYTPEVTRGIAGWWKEPVSTTFSFLNDRGGRYAIDWVIKRGNDVTRLNPLGSSSLVAKKYYHTVKLPDGTASEVGVVQPAGLLRIEREKKIVKVFIDDQAAVVGTMAPIEQLTGFEIDVVNAKNGALSFTDFKIAR